jgi:hypothetical protein
MGYRASWIAVTALLLSTSALAQDGLRSASLPERTPQNPIPMGSQPGVRSGSLPDRNPTTSAIPPARVDQFIAHPRTYTPRLPGEPPRRGRFQNFLFGGYAPGYADGYAPRDTMPEAIPGGYLHLDLQPGSAQVYVDGLYMGTVDDFRRLIPGRALEAGAHRVEIRLAGYESAAFDVLIHPSETTTYRADLQLSAERQRASAAPAAPPKTFYVIPGCYAGDKPPSAQSLRKGCDRSKVRVIPPAVNTVAHNR